MANESYRTSLKRVIGLPLLVFYGLGVTIGAGIFALVGEVLALAGDRAPQSFLLAAIIAGATGLSYALLVRIYPRAGGEAIFVNNGLGKFFGFLAGAGVIVTGIVSSAAIAVSFSGYAATLVAIPQWIPVVSILVVLAGIACWGVRESVVFAAVITVLELSTLLVVAVFGLPRFVTLQSLTAAFAMPDSATAMAPVLSAAILAFFAFIGFEDIENMAEETKDPTYAAPRAIFWTLGITTLAYLAISMVAVSVPQRELVAGSSAPMKDLFELSTGMRGEAIAVMASIAMINGILIQIVMVSRMVFGMATEKQLPAVLSRVHETTRTPVIATVLVTAVIILLALTLPLVRLAALTSYVTLVVFAMVNFSLYAIGRKSTDRWAHSLRWWGIAAGLLCLVILAGQLIPQTGI